MSTPTGPRPWGYHRTNTLPTDQPTPRTQTQNLITELEALIAEKEDAVARLDNEIVALHNELEDAKAQIAQHNPPGRA